MKETKDDEFIIVDVDALFNCDIHWMLLKHVFKEDFFYAIKLCFMYIFFGNHYLSDQLSSYLDSFNLDFFVNQNVLEYLRLKSGKVYFCANMCEGICKKIFNDYYEIFDGYLCASSDMSLLGLNKLLSITSLVNDGSFLYIGASKNDMIIWKACDIAGIVLFDKSDSLIRKLKKLNKEYVVFYVSEK